jgi:hypothetical protein
MKGKLSYIKGIVGPGSQPRIRSDYSTKLLCRSWLFGTLNYLRHKCNFTTSPDSRKYPITRYCFLLIDWWTYGYWVNSQITGISCLCLFFFISPFILTAFFLNGELEIGTLLSIWSKIKSISS